MRLTTNAFLPALAAVSLVNQNEMSRYEHAPTPSHPRNRRTKLSAITRISIEKANRLRIVKYLGNRSSWAMYPIEYRWISVPTPVTNSAIVMDSGSTRKAACTSRFPTWIQVNTFFVTDRACSSRDSSEKKVTTAETNAPSIAVVAT